MTEAELVNLEITLFDRWVIARREGRDPDARELARQLPEERRSAFLQRIGMTSLFAQAGETMKERIRSVRQSHQDTARPTIVDGR